MKPLLVYLASPYSKYPAGREAAFKEVCKKAGQLMNSGWKVFCPIAHSHPIEQSGAVLDNSHRFWLEQDFAVLCRCSVLFVYKMPGWEDSFGVTEEIKMANALGISIRFLEYGEEDVT